MKKAYTGGCQCGKVRYEAQADIGEVITCNSFTLPQGRLVAFRGRDVGLQASVRRSRHDRVSVQQPQDPSPVLQDLQDPVICLRQGPRREGYGDDQRSLSRRPDGRRCPAPGASHICLQIKAIAEQALVQRDRQPPASARRRHSLAWSRSHALVPVSSSQ